MGNKKTELRNIDPKVIALMRDPRVKQMAAENPVIREKVAEMRRRIRRADIARDAQLLEWAGKKIDGYLRWQMESKAHDLALPNESSGGKTFEEMTVDDVATAGFGLPPVDLDFKDWIDVDQWLLEFVGQHPEAKPLPELLVHCRYHCRPAWDNPGMLSEGAT